MIINFNTHLKFTAHIFLYMYSRNNAQCQKLFNVMGLYGHYCCDFPLYNNMHTFHQMPAGTNEQNVTWTTTQQTHLGRTRPHWPGRGTGCIAGVWAFRAEAPSCKTGHAGHYSWLYPCLKLSKCFYLHWRTLKSTGLVMTCSDLSITAQHSLWCWDALHIKKGRNVEM